MLLERPSAKLFNLGRLIIIMPHKLTDEEITSILSKLSDFDLARILEFKTNHKYTVIDKESIRETLYLTKEMMTIIDIHAGYVDQTNKDLKAKWQKVIKAISL